MPIMLPALEVLEYARNTIPITSFPWALNANPLSKPIQQRQQVLEGFSSTGQPITPIWRNEDSQG